MIGQVVRARRGIMGRDRPKGRPLGDTVFGGIRARVGLYRAVALP